METIPLSEESVGFSFKWVEPSETSFVLGYLPYINGLTEPLQRLLRNMEFELSPDPTVPYIRNSLRQNSGHPATFKQMRSTRFPAMTAVGATLKKPGDGYRREEKNTSETLNIVN